MYTVYDIILFTQQINQMYVNMPAKHESHDGKL